MQNRIEIVDPVQRWFALYEYFIKHYKVDPDQRSKNYYHSLLNSMQLYLLDSSYVANFCVQLDTVLEWEKTPANIKKLINSLLNDLKDPEFKKQLAANNATNKMQDIANHAGVSLDDKSVPTDTDLSHPVFDILEFDKVFEDFINNLDYTDAEAICAATKTIKTYITEISPMYIKEFPKIFLKKIAQFQEIIDIKIEENDDDDLLKVQLALHTLAAEILFQTKSLITLPQDQLTKLAYHQYKLIDLDLVTNAGIALEHFERLKTLLLDDDYQPDADFIARIKHQLLELASDVVNVKVVKPEDPQNYLRAKISKMLAQLVYDFCAAENTPLSDNEMTICQRAIARWVKYCKGHNEIIDTLSSLLDVLTNPNNQTKDRTQLLSATYAALCKNIYCKINQDELSRAYALELHLIAINHAREGARLQISSETHNKNHDYFIRSLAFEYLSLAEMLVHNKDADLTTEYQECISTLNQKFPSLVSAPQYLDNSNNSVAVAKHYLKMMLDLMKLWPTVFIKPFEDQDVLASIRTFFCDNLDNQLEEFNILVGMLMSEKDEKAIYNLINKINQELAIYNYLQIDNEELRSLNAILQTYIPSINQNTRESSNEKKRPFGLFADEKPRRDSKKPKSEQGENNTPPSSPEHS